MTYNVFGGTLNLAHCSMPLSHCTKCGWSVCREHC